MIILIFLILLILLFIFFRRSTFTSILKVGLICMMKDPKNIETWIDHHRKFGITHFYIQLEDTPSLEEYLRLQPDVTLNINKSTGVNEYMEKMTRQTIWADKSIQYAKENNIDWLFHIDSDELLEGPIDALNSIPSNIDTFWIQNHEAVYKDVPTSEDNCFQAVKYINCATGGCVSYANGKSGCRVNEYVSSNGCHRFKSTRPDSEIFLEAIYLNHYESCDFDSYKIKYKQLSQKADIDSIPFPYYRDSIKASGSDEELREVYKKYRTV